MVPIQLNHAFDWTLTLHLLTVLNKLWSQIGNSQLPRQAIEAQSISHEAINMGRYNFYGESPNDLTSQMKTPLASCIKVLVQALTCL
jgi:hypothetical protein